MKWFFLVTGQLNDKCVNQVGKFEATFKKCKAVTVLSNAELAVTRTVQRQSMQGGSLQGNIIDNPFFLHSQMVYCRKYRFAS